MDKSGEEIKSIILDTNIVFSSLVKEEGYTQAILAILLSQNVIEILSPSTLKTEIYKHINEISRKSRVPANVLKTLINIIFSNIKIIDEKRFKKEIIEAFNLVTDRKDSPFAGLAIKYSPSIILTYNKKHFHKEKLRKMNVFVFEPKELVKYFELEIKLEKIVKNRGGNLSLLNKLYDIKRASRHA